MEVLPAPELGLGNWGGQSLMGVRRGAPLLKEKNNKVPHNKDAKKI